MDYKAQKGEVKIMIMRLTLKLHAIIMAKKCTLMALLGKLLTAYPKRLRESIISKHHQ